MNSKRVSLILTSYNCKDNVRRTLESIEAQDYPDIEVVIADGASTDGTFDGAHADLIYATDEKVKRYWKMGQGGKLGKVGCPDIQRCI